MDIGMLLDMDNFTESISPAVHSSTSIASLAFNDNTSARSQEVPRTPRAHLQPMTNINEPHSHVQWDRQTHHPMKQWAQYDQYQYSSPQSVKNLPASNAHYFTPVNLIQDANSCTGVRPSFPSNTGMYDGKTGQYSSPVQSQEDLQWQMYLTASLSNPLNSLEFVDSHSSPLLYASDIQGPGGVDSSFQIDSSLFPSANDSAFPPSQNPDIFNSIPFIESPTRTTSGFRPYHAASSSMQRNAETSTPAQQNTPHHSRDAHNISSDGSYAALLGFTPLANFTFVPNAITPPGGPHDEVPIAILSSPINPSPTCGRSKFRGPQSSGTKGQRLMSGWENDYSLKPPSTLSSLGQRKRRRSTSSSPSAPMRLPHGLSPLSLSSSVNSESTSSTHNSKRRRQILPPTSSSIIEADEFESEDEFDNAVDDDGSDDYRPSRSPSPNLVFGNNFPLEFERQESKQRQSKAAPAASSPSKKKSRRGKGKAKGSAALALAVVTQLGSKGLRGSSDQHTQNLEDLDVMALYQEGKTGIRKRKNNAIPLPIPVPNLNKKSRGRKVPFVADLSAEGVRRSASMLSADNVNDQYHAGEDGVNGKDNGSESTGRSRNLRKSTTPAPVVDESGWRTYVCTIPGCGKCFVRGEHLKRHIRSIHTHDKPHHCPYEGCDKSFSRRDNLGQHVRIHLQP